MKVISIPSIARFHAYPKIKCANNPPGVTVQKTDKLELSEERQFQELLKAARNAPAVRSEKVKAVKRQIEAGTYHVKSRSIAEKIIEQAERCE